MCHFNYKLRDYFKTTRDLEKQIYNISNAKKMMCFRRNTAGLPEDPPPPED